MIVDSTFRILGEVINNKKSRELFCRVFITENPLLIKRIISHWELERINHKYILKDRMYDENSYSKKQIRNEEKLFLRVVTTLQPVRFFFEQQVTIIKELNNEVDPKTCVRDRYFYHETLFNENHEYEVPATPFYFKKNGLHRVDVTNEFIEVADVRETIINEYLKYYPKVTHYIIENYDLKFVKYKYIQKIMNKNETSYTRSKVKKDELFLLRKIILYVTWINQIANFYQLQKYLAHVDKFQDFVEDYTNELLDTYLNDDFEVEKDLIC